MTTIPKINFAPTVTETELQKIETDGAAARIRFFEPGVYDLKVLEFALHVSERNPTGASKGDPTWLVYKMALGGLDSRTISTFVLIPTQTDRYNKPGMKNPMMMIGKFREFLRGLGVVPEQSKLKEIITRLVTDPASLTGLDVKVRIGYTKPYIQYSPEKKVYNLVSSRGIPMDDAEYVNRDAAKVGAIEKGIADVQSFPEVVRFFEQEVTETETSTTEDWT